MYFFTLLSKADNFCDFLFASLDDEMFSKRNLLLKDFYRFLPCMGAVAILVM